MSVDIGGALSEGLDRLLTETGAILVAVFVGMALVSTVVWNSFQQVLQAATEQTGTGAPAAGPGSFPGAGGGALDALPLAVLELPLSVLAVLLLAVLVVQLVVQIGTIRWFVEAEGSSPLTRELFTRRLLWTVGNLIVGGIIFGIAVFVGFLLLFFPGVFLLVALYFYNYEIVVEGENALDALENSWSLTKGNRINLFVLGLIFTVIQITVAMIYLAVFFSNPTAGVLVNSVLGSIVGVFGIAVAADAYNQLRGVEAPDADLTDPEEW